MITIKNLFRKKVEEPKVTHASYHATPMVYCPTVAYVKGLEEYKNPRYRMVASNENAIHPMADNA